MKHKEMLIAGNWYDQTFDLVPAQQPNITKEMGENYFGELLEKIREINPELTFEFNRWPCLTIKNGDETVGVFAHPDPIQRQEHTKKFGCTVALFNGAFENKHIVEDLRQILPLFNSSLSDLNVRNDLGDKKQIAEYSLNRITQGAFDHVHFAELRSLYLKPSTLADNFNKINGYDKGWIDGDRDRDISEEFVNLLKENPSFFRFSNNQDEKLDAQLQEAFAVLDGNVSDEDKKGLMSKEEAQKIYDERKRLIKEEQELVEKLMKDYDLYWHPKKGNPYEDDDQKNVHICNKYGRSLVSFKKLEGNINIHASGMHNDAAIAFAAAMAYERFGHDKLYWSVSKSFRKHTSDEELALIADKTLNALIKAGFEPEQIFFPKDLQYLVNRKIDEMKNNMTFDEATPEQVNDAKNANPDPAKAVATVDDVVVESLPNGPVIDQPVNGPASPNNAAGGVSGPVTGESTPETTNAAKPSTESDSKPAVQPQKVFVFHDCYLVKSKKAELPENEVYQLIGIKGKVSIKSTDEMKEVIQFLADKQGINPGQINACWLTHDSTPLYTMSAIKKLEGEKLKGLSDIEQEELRKSWKEENNFKFAYEVLSEMKHEDKRPKADIAEPANDESIAGYHVSQKVTADVPQYANSDDLEKHVANAVGKLEVLETPEYKDYQVAKEEKKKEFDEPSVKRDSNDTAVKGPTGLEAFDVDLSAVNDVEREAKAAHEQIKNDLSDAIKKRASKIKGDDI